MSLLVYTRITHSRQCCDLHVCSSLCRLSHSSFVSRPSPSTVRSRQAVWWLHTVDWTGEDYLAYNWRMWQPTEATGDVAWENGHHCCSQPSKRTVDQWMNESCYTAGMKVEILHWPVVRSRAILYSSLLGVMHCSCLSLITHTTLRQYPETSNTRVSLRSLRRTNTIQ